MKKQKTPQQELIKAVGKAGGSFEHVDIPGWENSQSAGEWVRASRRLDNERLERIFAASRAIQQDNKDADTTDVLTDVTEAVDAVRRKA